jgi:hypothetical protein
VFREDGYNFKLHVSVSHGPVVCLLASAGRGIESPNLYCIVLCLGRQVGLASVRLVQGPRGPRMPCYVWFRRLGFKNTRGPLSICDTLTVWLTDS